MDSLTQFLLGASIGEAVAGRRFGRVSAVVGGVAATLPDLDVLFPFADAVATFTYHRGASHSLLVLALIAPVLAAGFNRLMPLPKRSYRLWLLVVMLALLTHPLLDAMTVYGTQLLWPLTEFPFGVGSMFIIDPLYSVPLLAALLVGLVSRRRVSHWNGWALALTTLYLGLSVGLQTYVRAQVDDAVAALPQPARAVGIVATPFNIAAWRVVVVHERDYHVGYLSLLHDAPLVFERYDSRPELLQPVARHWPVARLKWFTKGLYAVHERNAEVVVSDLRMGLEPDHYVFSFAVAAVRDGKVEAAPARRVPAEPYSDGDWRRLAQLIFGFDNGVRPAS
ncbi:MAG: metal-dependent hydrolase [Pseudomonadota bacterium]